MKLENIIYQIRHILKTTGIDSRVDDRMLIDMINRYRAFNIKQYYQSNRHVKEEWFTNLGVIDLSIVNSADDPNIQLTSVVFGKYSFPNYIEIPGINTIVLRSASKHQRIEEVNQEILYKRIETDDDITKDFVSVYFEGNIGYIYPHQSKISCRMILADPRDGITYNELKDFNNNVISAQGTKRNLTIRDEYPICGEIATLIILDILTKEFNLERTSIPDISVDGADTDEIVKSPI
jgi:hypothetical protein